MRTTLTVGIALGALLIAPGIHSITAPLNPAVMTADRKWVAAAGKSDKDALTPLLDADFTWTDVSGKTLDRAAVSQKPPVVPVSNDKNARVIEYTYGDVAAVQVSSGTMHVLRVWVKRPAGWRLLAYQEVKSLSVPPTVTPGTGSVCENPCKTLPYQPKNADEKGVVESYMGLETASVGHDAKQWDAHTAAEFLAASSNSNKLLDKPTRLAELRKANMSGLAPTPMLSTRLFDFPGAVVMISTHRPDKGKDLHITRVWVKRGGTWVATLSYQTAIQ